MNEIRFVYLLYSVNLHQICITTTFVAVNTEHSLTQRAIIEDSLQHIPCAKGLETRPLLSWSHADLIS